MLQHTVLLSGATTTQVGQPAKMNERVAVFQAKLYGTSGALSATVKLWGSLDPMADSNQSGGAKELLATFSLSGTGLGDSLAVDSGVWSVTLPYRTFWGEVSAISGTGAAVDMWAAV